jgi:hypothetical protein
MFLKICNAGVVCKAILRLADGGAGGEALEVCDQQVGFDQIGVLEVLPVTLFKGEMSEAAVIVVEMKVGSFCLACEFFCQRLC